MLSPDDKKGRVDHLTWLPRGFQEVVSKCNLYDLLLLGYLYTWECRKGSSHAVEERIEWALVYHLWKLFFPQATLTNLSAPISYHNPILLNIEPELQVFYQCHFYFENIWLKELELEDVIKHNWCVIADSGFMKSLESFASVFSIEKKWPCKEDMNQYKNIIEAIWYKDDPDSVSTMQNLKIVFGLRLGKIESSGVWESC